MRVKERADRNIEFIQKLKITIGDDAGKRFLLRHWQEAYVRDIYEPADAVTLNRKVRRAILSIARKNGKTELAAALILLHLIGPEAELNGEIYSAANDRGQAAIVFNAVKRMILANPSLSKHLKIVDSTKHIYVKTSGIKAAGSKFVALSAEAGTKHGLNPSFVVYDELAQAKNRELLSVLTTSQGGRKEPLFLTISTQNNDPTHPLSEMIDDGLAVDDEGNKLDETVVCHLYAADDDCDVLDEQQWLNANPALGDFRSYDELKVMAQRAARLPAEEAEFRLLYLNQRVSLHAPFVAQSDWKKCRGEGAAPCFEYEPGEAIYLGLDMSKTTDLTALVGTSIDNKARIKGWYWKPEELVMEHTKRDRSRYDLWAKDGWLSLSPGRTINPRLIARKVIDLMGVYDVRGLVFDPNRMAEVLRYFDDEGVIAQEGVGDGLRLIPWGQSFPKFAPAMTAFEHAVLEDELLHDGNPITTMCVSNAMAITNENGDRKLDKKASRMRIDGAVALAMALGQRAIDRAPAAATSPWEDENFSII